MVAKTLKELPNPDFRDVIGQWPSRAALAGDLGEQHWLVEAWHRKNSIPPRWFAQVVRSAIKRDIDGVSTDLLLQLHTKRMEQGPTEPPPAKKNFGGNSLANAEADA